MHLALHDLGLAHLLESPGPAKGLTRRELIRRLGAAAAIALPLVSTVAAPTAAEAQSCIPQGAFTCSLVTPPFCCPGLTCTVGGCQPA